jgi:mRNA interferase RelE/StbE
MRRTMIQWTETAKKRFARLPASCRQGLLAELAKLQDDHITLHKPLTDPLQRYYRLSHSRFRIIYSIEEEKLANDNILEHVKVLFIAAGRRSEGDKADIYRLAKKLLELGALDEFSGASVEEARDSYEI